MRGNAYPSAFGVCLFVCLSLSPYLGAQLVCLDLGLLLESVVGVVVGEGVLDERGEHEHVADPEVDVQGLDGRRARQRGPGAHHQRGHGQHGGDACRAAKNMLAIVLMPIKLPAK